MKITEKQNYETSSTLLAFPYVMKMEKRKSGVVICGWHYRNRLCMFVTFMTTPNLI